MKGWFYVITNKGIPSLVKVGYSMKDPELRAVELKRTGVPHPYVVDYEVLVEDPRDVEKMVHDQLRDRREGKEWFRCSVEEAVAVIKTIVGSKALFENFKRADRIKAEAIQRQKDAEEKARRSAEEERRRREAVLDRKRQEILSRYEPLLKEALPKTTFWDYFAVVFIALMITFALFFPKMEDSAAFILMTIGAFVITPCVKSHLEEKAKESDHYKSILAQRDAELATVERERAKLREHS